MIAGFWYSDAHATALRAIIAEREGKPDPSGILRGAEDTLRQLLAARELDPVESIPAYAVITRAIWERGETQRQAVAELQRRGLWLTTEQRRQAGLPAERAAP